MHCARCRSSAVLTDADGVSRCLLCGAEPGETPTPQPRRYICDAAPCSRQALEGSLFCGPHKATFAQGAKRGRKPKQAVMAP